MTADTRAEAPKTGRSLRKGRTYSVIPGVVLSTAVAGIAFAVSHLIAVSAIMVALVIGALLTNTIGVAPRLRPGVDLSARRLLRIGIVLLGLQLVVHDLVNLGASLAGVVVATVVVTFIGTEVVGRALGVPATLTTLVAAGFSICGAAAVAAVSGVTDSDEEEVATAVGLVTLFGTAMILLVPLSADVLALTDQQAGFWAGAAVHEVAQVVAAAGALSGAAVVMTTAVSAKLARVVLLAPLTLWVGLRVNRRHRHAGSDKRPPLVPLFVLGFLAAAALRHTGLTPDGFLEAAEVAQSLLLAAAMFALGCAVRVRALFRLGMRPVVLATFSTVLAAATSLAGILTFG